MARQSSFLVFATSNQSQWGPGTGTDLSVDTGDSLITTLNGSQDISFGALGFGLEAEAYFDLQLGIYAWASLGRSGSLDATLGVNVTAEFMSGMKINTAGQLEDPDIATDFGLDLSDWSVTSASIKTTGFDTSPGAGLDLILRLEAGIRNGSLSYWGGSTEIADLKFIDVDRTGDNAIPLVEVSTDIASVAIETGPVSISATLPTGANTSATRTFDTGGGFSGPITIGASGVSETRFIEMQTDLDELFVLLGSRLGAAGPAIKLLGETVFAEHTFDANDYLPYIPRGRLEIAATLLDISLINGLALTESHHLDFGGADNTPRINVTLSSDNGTPDDATDDPDDITTYLGSPDAIRFAKPVFGADGGSVPSLGDVTITATYALESPEYTHSLGLSLSTLFNISAFQAELTGAWVPSFLKVNFGPLLSLDIPDADGWNLDLFSLALDPFQMADGAFAPVTETYKIFYTTEYAPDQTSEDDLQAANARQAIIDYRLERQQNLEAALGTFGDLKRPDQFRQNVFEGYVDTAILAGNNNFSTPPIALNAIFAAWDGNTDAVVARQADANVASNFFDVVVVQPLASLPAGSLWAGATDFWTNPPQYVNFEGNLSDGTTAIVNSPTSFTHDIDLLNTVNTDDGYFVGYKWDAFAGNASDRTLLSNRPTSVQGGDFGDLLLFRGRGFEMIDDFSGAIFDGGGQSQSGQNRVQYDRFVADFSFHTGAIEWDLQNAVESGEGVRFEVGFGVPVEVINVEALTLRTGSGDDFIKGYDFADKIFTGGGNDFVVLPWDFSSDLVELGSGDDYARIELALQGPTVASARDRVFGGTGYDHVTIVADQDMSDYPSVFKPSLHLQLVDAAGNDLFPSALSPNSASASLLSLLDSYTNSPDFFGLPFEDATGRTGAAGTADHLVSTVYFQAPLGTAARGTAVSVNVSVEDLSVVGSNEARDLILYSGGSQYQGGTHIGDVLLADFSVFATRVGATAGVNARADGSAFGFGSSAFDGFDKFVVRGSAFNDFFAGGSFHDYIDGGDGDDIIFGGDDVNTTPFPWRSDTLIGGAGSDVIHWSDGGPDILAGFDLQGNADDPEDIDTLNIGAEFYSALPLVWAFLADNSAMSLDANLALRALRGPLGIVSATSSIEDLLAGLDLAQDAGGVTGVGYGTFTDITDMMIFRGFDVVNVFGEEDSDDLLLYLGGQSYFGGEFTADRDLFLADFSDQLPGIDLRLQQDMPDAVTLANGVKVQGIDRLVLRAGLGDDIIHGEQLDDYIDGGAGHDRLFGGLGNDTLLGNLGNDVIWWTVDGDDIAQGGAGDDRLIVAGLDPDLVPRALGIWLDRGLGTELSVVGGSATRLQMDAILSALDTATSVSIRADGAQASGPDSIVSVALSGFESVDVTGTDEASDLIVYLGGDIYWGGDGAARDVFLADLSSESGPLSFEAGYRSPAALVDPTDAGIANTYDIGNGTLIGGFEGFGLRLGTGDDTVLGGAGADVVFGGAGDDYFMSGGSLAEDAFADRFVGGAGNDVMVWDGGAAFFDGGDGAGDSVSWTGADTAIGLTLGTASNNAGSYQASDLLTMQDVAQFAVTQSFWRIGFFDRVLSQNELSFTRVEQVRAQGSSEADVLIATGDGSILLGGASDDVLIASAGDDILGGGSGRDRYLFIEDFGDDLIVGEDVGGADLFFRGHLWDDLNFALEGETLVITSGANSVRVAGFGGRGDMDFRVFAEDRIQGTTLPMSLQTGTYSGYTQIIGTDGDDAPLAGSEGNDFVRALRGDDRILATPGADIVDGGPVSI